MNAKSFHLQVGPVLGVIALMALAACTESAPTSPSVPTGPSAPTLIGDFAPLRVGNTWTYTGDVTSRYSCNSGVGGYGSVRTLSIVSREERGDTVVFGLLIRDSLTSRWGNIFGMSDTASRDSIVETSQGIVPSGRFPFFEAHAKFDTVARDSVSWEGGVRKAYRVSSSSESGGSGQGYMSTASSSRTFALNLGLVTSSEASSYVGGSSCSGSSRSYALTAFTPGDSLP